MQVARSPKPTSSRPSLFRPQSSVPLQRWLPNPTSRRSFVLFLQRRARLVAMSWIWRQAKSIRALMCHLSRLMRAYHHPSLLLPLTASVSSHHPRRQVNCALFENYRISRLAVKEACYIHDMSCNYCASLPIKKPARYYILIPSFIADNV